MFDCGDSQLVVSFFLNERRGRSRDFCRAHSTHTHRQNRKQYTTTTAIATASPTAPRSTLLPQCLLLPCTAHGLRSLSCSKADELPLSFIYTCSFVPRVCVCVWCCINKSNQRIFSNPTK